MTRDQPTTLNLQCTGCSARFRLRVVRSLPESVECPKCATSIPIQRDEGLEKKSIADVFGRQKTAVREAMPEAEPEKKRVFQDVTQVRLNLGAGNAEPQPDPGEPSFGAADFEEPPEPPEPSKPQRLSAPSEPRQDGSDAQEDIPSSAVLRRRNTSRGATPRLPRAPEDKNVRNREEAVDPSQPEAPETDSTLELPLDELAEARRKAGIAQAWTLAQARAALDEGVRARVGDEVFGPLDLPGLKLLLRSDVWLGAVELEYEGQWLTMSRHPLLPLIQRELKDEALEALRMVTVSTSAERVRAQESVPPELPELPPLPKESVAEESAPEESPTESVPAESVPAELAEPAADGEPVAQEPREVFEEVPEPELDSSLESDRQPDPEPEIAPRRSWPTTGIVVVLVIASVVGLYVWQDREPPPTPPVTIEPPTEALHHAFMTGQSARALTAEFAALREQTTPELRESIRDHVERADFGAALALVHEVRRRDEVDVEFVELQTRALVGAGEWAQARELIIEAYQIERAPEFEALFERVSRDDPALRDVTFTLPDDGRIDAIEALGGGRSISLKLVRAGKNVYAFKPAQVEWEDGWRSEIAAYRFCEIVRCNFEIPWSATARVSREDFEELYGMETLKQRNYAERFEDLNWVTEAGPDGVQREYLYGVIKDWVPSFTEWPIEYTHVWEPWLRASTSVEALDLPLERALEPLGLYKSGLYARRIEAHASAATTRSIAAQLSDMLVFDYLTNNWDRFSRVEEYYGVNTHFAHGRFVSIDNGACFHLQSSTRVDARFEPVERFSRSLVVALQMLERSWLDPILFPNASVSELDRLDVFWTRHMDLLARVEELVESRGEADILFFD